MEPCAYERVTHNRERILSLWQAALLPQGGGLTLRDDSKNRFAAPTDYLLRKESEALFDWLLSEEEPAQARSSLQEICKLKAVQTNHPSEALGFILDLKSILRLVLGKDGITRTEAAELKVLDRRIDQLLLLAFDEYSDCREQIMELRIEEIRRLCGRSAS